jgi:hypothetical protein
MATRYKKTQLGTVLVAVLGSGVIILGNVLATYGFDWWQFAVCMLLLACLVLFATLTVEIDDKALKVYLGPGLIRKTIPLDQIESWEVMRVPWYCGFGLRWVPGRVMYRVSGLYVVALRLKSGKKSYIGSPEPDILARAISAATGK